MTLEELAAKYPTSGKGSVPASVLGCFRRRSITFYNGTTDSATTVYWLQSRGLSADFRFGPASFRSKGRKHLADYTDSQIKEAALREGGLSQTAWDGQLMKWFDWTAFQVHDKWPEPASLRRVGDCIIEFAPSGAYVEDWRLQSSPPGSLIGLRLIEERKADTGEVLHRGGGLIICGQYGAFVRGRPSPLQGPGVLIEQVRKNIRDRAFLQSVFSCDASFGIRSEQGGSFYVAFSTDPRREGEPLLAMNAFSFDEASQSVLQRTQEGGIAVERTFTVDTLESCVEFSATTPASEEAQSWLSGESETLLAYASTSEAPIASRRA
jgi:hypothetical protein